MLNINTSFQRGERVFSTAAKKRLLGSQLVSEEMSDSSLTWGLFGSEGKGAQLSANQPNPEKETDSFLPNWSVSYSITQQKPWGLACRSGTDHIWGGMSVPSRRVLVCTYWSWANSTEGIPQSSLKSKWESDNQKLHILHEEMVKIHNDNPFIL